MGCRHSVEEAAGLFATDVYPAMVNGASQYVSCHAPAANRRFTVTSDATETFYQARGAGFFADDQGSMLARLINPDDRVRMPQAAPAWPDPTVQAAARVGCMIKAFELGGGTPADEQFPPELLLPYSGTPITSYDNPFLNFVQLKNKVRSVFNDTWVRTGVDQFERNIGLFGGVNFTTHFVEARVATPDFLLGLDSLAPDVCGAAATAGNGPFEGLTLTAPIIDVPAQTVTTFAESYGANYPMANVSWHRWLSDGELEEANYPEGTGFYEKLGPAYAHTVYGRTPAEMRNRLSQLGNVTAGARTARIRTFVDNLHQNFIAEHNGESVAAFSSAVDIYKQLTSGTGVIVDPGTLFTDPTLRSEFGVTASDEATNSTSVNGNPARSKDSPNVNVQALMAYELMTKGLSLGFWIENRQIRGYDTHQDRAGIMNSDGQTDQLAMLRRDLWNPLKVFVNKLKTTQFGTSGKSFWDLTTIVLASEMGRTIQGDVASILASTDPDPTKYTKIMEQDCCQHWKVNSVAFLGGTVQGDRQWGRVGTSSLEGIPLMPDGTLDPAYNPTTGILTGTKSPSSVIPNAGHVYATALHLAGINPTGKGKNSQPALAYIKKP